MNAKQRFLYVTGGCGFVLILVYAVLVMPVQGEVTELRAQQETLKQRIESDLNSEEYHGEVDLQRIQQEITAFQDTLVGLKKTLDQRIDPKYQLEGSTQEPYLAFKGALDETRTVLNRKAANADIAIPADYGFPAGEVATPEIPALMRRLDLMALAIGKAIDSGVKAVTAIAPIAVEEANAVKNPLIVREQISMEIQGGFDSVVRFLHAINLPADFVSVQKLTLESASTEGDQLKVSMVIAGLEIHPEVSLEPKAGGGTKPANGGSRPWVPGR